MTVSDLKAQGALTALLRDALSPNLVQTLGGTPAIVHGGPFGNIAHGCNSLIATDTALRHADVVLTEAGFGSDLGAEKFFDIKSRAGDLDVSAVVMVATIRSLKFNGGAAKDELQQENLAALQAGLVNLARHCDNIQKFGPTPTIALNHFIHDTDAEVELVQRWAEDRGLRAVVTKVWAEGGAGAAELADVVLASVVDKRSAPLYDPAAGTLASLQTIAREIYGASDVELSPQAQKDLKFIQDNGWDTLPVCISKTQYSFSDDPRKLGAPSGHTVKVRSLVPRTGAGFVVAMTGDVMTLPGLSKRPAAQGIDVDAEGNITGLF